MTAARKQRHTHLGTAKPGFKPSRSARAYLSNLLPVGWESFFSTVKAGKYLGLSITCPHCEARPPKELMGAQRWRWMSVHIVEHKNLRKV